MTPMGPTDPQDKQPWWHADTRLDVLEAEVARLTAERDQLKETLELVNRIASPGAFRNLDQAINDLAHIADEVRFALSRLDSPGSGGDRGRP